MRGNRNQPAPAPSPTRKRAEASRLFSDSAAHDSTTAKRALTLLASLLVLSSALALVSFSIPTAQAESGTGKELTFLLHSVNATETAKPLPGSGSTLTYFDTTLDFNDANVSVLVEGTQKVLQWFLVPALAGDFSVEGFTLRIWANSSTAASSNAQITLEIHELNATTSALVHLENVGSQDFPLTHTLKAWNATLATPYVFRAGSSIELRMTVTPGALQGVWFHYDTPQVNSRVSLSGPDSLDVAVVSALDTDGNVTLNFEPGASNKDVTLRANVTDPLGAYDIRWVNLTLISPFDTLIVENASMARVGGTPIDFESVYELGWNYSGQPTGLYTVEVWALDNNGHNHYYFFQQFTFGAYPDTGTTSFFIGGLPHFVNVKAMDAAGGILAGADVVLVNAGFSVARNVTDVAGLANLSMTEDTYEFQILWQGVLVASQVRLVDANVSAADPLVLTTRVYSPVLEARTAEGSPLPGATFLLVHPNGDKLDPRKSDAAGQVSLAQIPGGNYSLAVSWRGIEVFAGVLEVTADGVLAVPAAVYELQVTAQSSGENLAGVFVSVQDETGLVFDAAVTGADGRVVLLLPQGSYTVQARYVTTYMGTLYDSGVVSTSVDLMDSTSVAVMISGFPPALTNTLVFLFGLVYAATIAALVGAFLVLRRKKSKG